MEEFYIRISSFFGDKTLKLNPNQTYLKLKQEISKHYGISEKELQIYSDQFFSQIINFPDLTIISKCFQNGSAIFLKNQAKVSISNKEEKKVEKSNKTSKESKTSKIYKESKNIQNSKDFKDSKISGSSSISSNAQNQKNYKQTNDPLSILKTLKNEKNHSNQLINKDIPQTHPIIPASKIPKMPYNFNLLDIPQNSQNSYDPKDNMHAQNFQYPPQINSNEYTLPESNSTNPSNQFTSNNNLISKYNDETNFSDNQNKFNEAKPFQTSNLNPNEENHKEVDKSKILKGKEKEILKKILPGHAINKKIVGVMAEESKEGENVAKADGTTNLCNHGPRGKCIHCITISKEEIKYGSTKCTHGPEAKCNNCINKDKLEGIKHEAFDRYLKDLALKCVGKHPVNGRCHLCLPPSQPSFKLDLNCKNHRPYPEGICNKCMPANIELKRQLYRHVDYVEFINQEEINRFLSYWQSNDCCSQRFGFLIGYFTEDKVYEDGVRAIVESIYEPPQSAEFDHFSLLDDPNFETINNMLYLIGFEIVGIIFTAIDHEIFVSSKDMRMMAQLQEKYSYSHPCGIMVPKFVTAVVKLPKDENDELVNCYMVSDQFQALERDNVFGEQSKPGLFEFRQPGPNELLPKVMIKGEALCEFPVDYFLVNVANGAPIQKHDFSFIKYYSFPIENRERKATNQTIRNFVRSGLKSSDKKHWFCDFHFLIAVATLMSPDIAAKIAICISSDQEIDEETISSINNF